MTTKTKGIVQVVVGAAASLLGFAVGVPGLMSLTGELNIGARDQKTVFGFFVFLGVVGLLLVWLGLSTLSIAKRRGE